MRSNRVARLVFAILGAAAAAAVFGGAACTRWGQPGPVTPTTAPLTSIYVDPHTGSDTTGNGSLDKPFKSMTMAVDVLGSAKNLSPSGVTIFLSAGDYNAANGEKFPIVVPKSVTISGSNYGSGERSGSFVDGMGEDTLFEHVVGAPPHTAYATLVLAPATSVGIGQIYVGATKVSLPNSRAFYVSLDDLLGTASASVATFGAGIVSPLQNVDGVLVAGGSLTCSSCAIRANDFGIGALSVPGESSGSGSGSSGSGSGSGSGSQFGPSLTLTHSTGDSTIAAKIVDILTDGSVNVTVSGETFERAQYAYEDALPPVIPAARGAIDFGGGATQSNGGNDFIGARVTEISVTRRNVTVYALDDFWNPNQQRSNRNGLYTRKITFASGASGKNVTILRNAAGSTVTVGPAPVPTPTSSASPTSSPTSSPT